MEEGWFYEGASIYRHFWLTKTAPLHVAKWDTFVRSTVGDHGATIDIDISVDNDARTDAAFTLVQDVIEPDGHGVARTAPDLSVNAVSEGTFKASLTVADPRLLEQLKAMGIKLSLYDSAPADRLWDICGFFVRDIVNDHSTAAFVHSILGMVCDLNLDCVAEGVETADPLEHLRRANCAEIQGYLFSRPVEVTQIEDLLRQIQADDAATLPQKKSVTR
jgi:hypothetical protein